MISHLLTAYSRTWRPSLASAITSPCPVTSANITCRAWGLAELIVEEKTAPLAVRMPKGMPPLESAAVAIHSVSGRPSPSTSTVCFDCAPCGTARPTDGQPACLPPLLPVAAVEDPAALLELLDEVEAAVPPPPLPAQPARSRPAARGARTAVRRRRMSSRSPSAVEGCNDRRACRAMISRADTPAWPVRGGAGPRRGPGRA